MERETKKVSKRVPTDEEFNNIEKEDIKNIVYSGYRDTDDVTFYDRGNGAHLWSSSSGGATAYHRRLYWSNAGVNRGLHDKLYGFSVRCIKD
jgi:uncharacterized protein (TIGR02145 family)